MTPIFNVFLCFIFYFQPAVVHLQGQETTIQVREGKDVRKELSLHAATQRLVTSRIQVQLHPTRPVLHSLHGLNPDVAKKSVLLHFSKLFLLMGLWRQTVSA